MIVWFNSDWSLRFTKKEEICCCCFLLWCLRCFSSIDVGAERNEIDGFNQNECSIKYQVPKKGPGLMDRAHGQAITSIMNSTIQFPMSVAMKSEGGETWRRWKMLATAPIFFSIRWLGGHSPCDTGVTWADLHTSRLTLLYRLGWKEEGEGVETGACWWVAWMKLDGRSKAIIRNGPVGEREGA